MLNCNDARLKEVPDKIPDDVVEIDLSYSDIALLQNDSFKNCANVKTLDLSNNKQIAVIWNSVLRSMPNLENVALQSTGISCQTSSFPDNTFADLLHLKSSSVQFNYDDNMSLDDFAFMMQKIPHTLEELHVDFPDQEQFLQHLTNFTKLRTFGMHAGCRSFCKVTNDTFKYLRNISLESLTIWAAHLTSCVQPLAFNYFPSLVSLEMGKTMSFSIVDFSPALIGLQNTKLQFLKLSYMSGAKFLPWDTEATRMVILNDSFCEKLIFPHLTNLQLDFTGLYAIQSSLSVGCFDELRNLKIINMTFNYLTFFNMQYLVSSHLQLMPNLIELDISHQNSLFFVKPLSITSKIAVPASLVRLNLSCIMHFGAMDRFDLEFPTSHNLKYLYMRNNFIIYLTSFKADSLVLIEVDFSRNNMISFADAFEVAINNGLVVRGLFLSENRLGGELENYGYKSFANFRDLAKLDLSSNNIKYLPPSVFKNLEQLEYLSLSKNALNFIRFKIMHMTKLRWLDISENMLSQFDVKLQQDIYFLKHKSPNLTINMLDNPFQCSCETRKFLEWMHNKHFMFFRYGEYNCIYSNNLFKFKI